RGDERALRGGPGLLLDDRGEDEGLVRILQRQSRLARLPGRVEPALHRGVRALEDLGIGDAGREAVRVGEEPALGAALAQLERGPDARLARARRRVLHPWLLRELRQPL